MYVTYFIAIRCNVQTSANPLVSLHFSNALQNPICTGQSVVVWSRCGQKLKTVRKVELASLGAAFLPAAA